MAVILIFLALLILCGVVFGAIFLGPMETPRKGSTHRGNVPSLETVLREVAALNEPSKTTILALMEIHGTSLGLPEFTKLCVAVSLAIVRPLDILREKVVLAEYLDSLSAGLMLLLAEDLFGFAIPDADLNHIITFESLLRYVESRKAPGNESDDSSSMGS
jgi:hypothetical protein